MARLYTREESPFWYAEITVHGVPLRISTGIPKGTKTRRKAQEAALLEGSRREAENRRSNSVTFGQAALAFLDENTPRRVRKLKASTLDHYAKKLVAVIDELGDLTLPEITTDRLKAYIKDRRKHTSDIQVRHELTAISSTLEFAVEQDMEGALEVNPVRLIRKNNLGKAASFPRWVEVEVIQKIFDASKGPFWPYFIRLILETGMRHEEALGLQWSDVDLSKGIINLRWQREKTDRGRLIPLSSTAINTLKLLDRRPSDTYVFTNRRTNKRYTSIWKGWGFLRKRAGAPTVRIHDIRHTFATWTRHSGMSRETRKSIMGHSSEDSHDLYAGADIRSLKTLMEANSPSTLLAQEREFAGTSGTGRNENVEKSNS